MMNTTSISIAAIVLNITSLSGTIFMGLICILMLSLLIIPIMNSNDPVLMLVANNYLALFTFAFLSTFTNIRMLQGDFDLFIAEETMICRISGYTLYTLLGVIFNTFALQAVFRFFRVVYPSYIWLQYRCTYLVLIPIMWILSFVLLLPVHLWHDIQLMPMEHVCLLEIHSARGFIWSTIAIYALPMNIISTIYIQLMRFVRRSSIMSSTRAKRDVVVVRRIVIVVSILMLIGLPSVVLELMLPFTDVGKPLFYRISNITMVIAMIALSLLLIYVTPQVKELLVCIRKANEITPSFARQRTILITTTTRY